MNIVQEHGEENSSIFLGLVPGLALRFRDGVPVTLGGMGAPFFPPGEAEIPCRCAAVAATAMVDHKIRKIPLGASMNFATSTVWNRRSGTVRVAMLALAAGLVAAAPAIAGDKLPGLVETITAKLAGRTGFAAQLVGSDPVISLNGDEAFPMASAYKVAIAGKVLAMVDKGEVSLDQMVDVPAESYVPSPVIADSLRHPGVSLSVANLIEVMIVHSDNTATDNLMALAGGAPAVTAWLREIGIKGMSVDRSTAQLSAQIEAILEAAGSDSDPSNPAIPAFDADPRDHTTPNEMLRLLILLDEGKVLKPQSRDFLLAVMGRTVTGPGRIKGLLPAGTPVAHKTGTVGGIANDAGFVTLPDGRRFAVAIFTKGSTTPPADRDRAVAETARVLYDFYALQ